MGLPLGTVNLFGIHIIPPLTINASTHFTYPQGDEELSQLPARFSQEWVVNPGPFIGRSATPPTELSWLITSVHVLYLCKPDLFSIGTAYRHPEEVLEEVWANLCVC